MKLSGIRKLTNQERDGYELFNVGFSVGDYESYGYSCDDDYDDVGCDNELFENIIKEYSSVSFDKYYILTLSEMEKVLNKMCGFETFATMSNIYDYDLYKAIKRVGYLMANPIHELFVVEKE